MDFSGHPAFSQAAGAQCRQMPVLLASRLQFPSMPRTTPPAQSPERAQLSVPFPPPRLPRRSPNTPAPPPHLGLQRPEPGAPSDLLPRLPQSPAPAPKAPAPRQSARGVDSGKPGHSRVPVPIPWHLRSRARHLPRRQLLGRRKGSE